MPKQVSIGAFFAKTPTLSPRKKRAREDDGAPAAAAAAAPPPPLAGAPASSSAAEASPPAAGAPAFPAAGAPAPAAASSALVALGLPAAHAAAPFLLQEARKPYFGQLMQHLALARRKGAVYPAPGRELAALALLPDLACVRVVILGQDPYHGAGQAHGLAFSVPAGVALPPSLRNILKEVAACLGAEGGGGGGAGGKPPHGSLERWARQGVLLLNTVLTVDAGAAFSHAGRGWERLTDAIIAEVARLAEGAVFMLWGKPSQEKRRLIQPPGRHLVLEAPHPSPLSAHRGFLGCAHFAKANAWLREKGKEPIAWWPL
jgi:uracil-DNA glycosylase